LTVAPYDLITSILLNKPEIVISVQTWLLSVSSYIYVYCTCSVVHKTSLYSYNNYTL